MPEQWRKRKSGALVLIATCEVCGCEAHWGFGQQWACAEHRQQVEARWVADGMGKSAEGER